MDTEEDILEHFGVKGMKWGVRRAAKKAAKADKKWETNINKTSTLIAIHNYAANKGNDIDIPRINGKSEYKGKDFTKDSPLRRKYYNEHALAFNKRLDEGAQQIVGSNPSGTKSFHIDPMTGRGYLKDIKHAAEGGSITLKYDELGHIIKFVVSDVLQQDSFVDDFLEHYGTKGMKWGVRKRSKKEEKERAKRFKAAKNRRHLSDEELTSRIDRLQKEKKLKELTDQDLRPGTTISKKIMSESGQKVARTVLAGGALLLGKMAVDKMMKSDDGLSPKDAVGYLFPKPKK